MTHTFSQLRILIVESQTLQRIAAEQTISGLGISHLTTAKSSEQALTTLQLIGPVDIVVCDLDMPGMDGVQFIRHLAEEQLATHLILLSALDSSLIRIVKDMAKAHRLTVLGNLPKPIARDRIRELLELFYGERPESGKAIITQELIFTKADLKKAIEEEQFTLYYQPKVSLRDGSLVSMEALARWIHPEAGMISPIRFIPLMESSGLITPMTLGLIDLALNQIQQWISEDKHTSIGINISPLMLNDSTLPDQLLKKLSNLNIPPHRLILEITENSLIEQVATTLEILARLKLHGFSLSIDDFGTGYSNMQQLNRIPFSELKIDRSFVSSISDSEVSKAIVETNINLAHKLRMKAVAEGIETTNDWEQLKQLNCDLAQGYFIAKPMPFEELPRWEKEWQVQYSQLSDL